MADSLWDSLCDRPVPEKYAPRGARLRADLHAAWDALTEPDRRSIAAFAAAWRGDSARLLAGLRAHGSQVYRAAIHVRGFALLLARHHRQEAEPAPRNEKPEAEKSWGGAPVEYETISYDAAGRLRGSLLPRRRGGTPQPGG